MNKSEITRLPSIDRKSSARTIGQMLKSINDYSLEKKRLLNFSSDTMMVRVKSSTKNIASKVMLNMPEKLPLLKSSMGTNSNSLTSDSSGVDCDRYQVALGHRVV